MTSLRHTALVVAAPTLFRQGLLAMLREAWPQLLLTLTADVTQVADLVASHPFSFVVLDGNLPGRALPSLLGRLRQARPGQRLVVLAGRPATALHLGALGLHTRLLHRHAPPPALLALLAPWLDEAPAPSLPPLRPQRMPLVTSSFSARELEVLRLVVDDNCNEEIANRLCLSVRTIESHRRMLLQKAGTRTLVGLAARAVREGWVA